MYITTVEKYEKCTSANLRQRRNSFLKFTHGTFGLSFVKIKSIIIGYTINIPPDKR